METVFCASVHTTNRDGTGNDFCGATAEDYQTYPKCLRPEPETTAETCARAMREIGVEPLWDYPEYNHLEGTYLGQRVLCIPAPSGLVR
jgi:hypothetical protein